MSEKHLSQTCVTFSVICLRLQTTENCERNKDLRSPPPVLLLGAPVILVEKGIPSHKSASIFSHSLSSACSPAGQLNSKD